MVAPRWVVVKENEPGASVWRTGTLRLGAQSCRRSDLTAGARTGSRTKTAETRGLNASHSVGVTPTQGRGVTPTTAAAIEADAREGSAEHDAPRRRDRGFKRGREDMMQAGARGRGITPHEQAPEAQKVSQRLDE